MNKPVRVARGRIFKVENLDRAFGSNETYNFVSVQDCREDEHRKIDEELLPTEYSLLFTDNEITVARQRALRNEEDLLQKDFLTDLTDDIL